MELCLQKPSQSARKADADDAREVQSSSVTLPACGLLRNCYAIPEKACLLRHSNLRSWRQA